MALSSPSYASDESDARDQASAAAGPEHPTAAAEIFILLFQLDPATDTRTPPAPVITLIALELAGLVFLARMI